MQRKTGIYVQHQHVIGKMINVDCNQHIYFIVATMIHFLTCSFDCHGPRLKKHFIGLNTCRKLSQQKFANIPPCLFFCSWTSTDGWCKNPCHGCVCWCPLWPNRCVTCKRPVVTLWNGWKLGTCACQADSLWFVAFSGERWTHLEIHMNSVQNSCWLMIVRDYTNHNMYI